MRVRIIYIHGVFQQIALFVASVLFQNNPDGQWVCAYTKLPNYHNG